MNSGSWYLVAGIWLAVCPHLIPVNQAGNVRSTHAKPAAGYQQPAASNQLPVTRYRLETPPSTPA